jgi:Zn-dependent protease with chaperone function
VNFFDAQDRARRATRWLVIVYIVATVLIVAGVTSIVAAAFMMLGEGGQRADPAALGAVAVMAALLIVGATVYKTASLSSGGGRVARDMGGTLVSSTVIDPLRQRLQNVVEEMAIASGIPVPEIYVLEQETGINAFAAGFTPDGAAIAVTRGTLETLNREELQGVIAHEFSHILNGDMRLNIRMMGVLFGIMVIGMMGRMMLRGRYNSVRNKNAAAVMVTGIGLTLLGWIGVFAARLVKAAVSRQREFLADASAVQFTRQTDGIANALKKIGGYGAHSYIKSVDPEEVSHMLFAGGTSRLTSMFATHPPLIERIRALDPSFNESEYPQVDSMSHTAGAGQDFGDVRTRGFASGASSAAAHSIPASISETVGQPDPQQIAYAMQIRESIPAVLSDAAHAPDLAWILTLALAIGRDPSHANRKLRFVIEQIGADRGQQVQHYAAEIKQIGAEYRLPILEIALPALRSRPRQQREYLVDLVRRLIELDGVVELHEYCFYRVVRSCFETISDPSGRRKGNRAGKKEIRQAAIDLLMTVAHHGHAETGDRSRAFQAGIAEFGHWANDESYDDGRTMRAIPLLDRSLDVLARMNASGSKSLLQALAKTVSHDGKVNAVEAELLHAICAALSCPLPPILGLAGAD